MVRTSEKHTDFWKLGLWIFVFLAFCGGCARDRGDLFFPPDAFAVWPEPPERPRIKYLGKLSTEADLKREVSPVQGLGELLFGKKEIGVLIAPYAVAVDAESRLFVTDTAGAVVHVFDLETRRYEQFRDLAGKQKLLKPVGLALIGHWIYVVDSALRRVCVFDKNGRFIFCFGGDRFVRPSGIAYWPSDKTVYVADTAGHTVYAFTGEGEFIRQIGARGVHPGMFNFPTHLWVDKAGTLYVSDTLNYRVQMFTRDGRFMRTFGLQGDRPGYFAHPCGIATDNLGYIYVTDRQFENVQIFNQRGEVLMAFGREGTGAGQFWLPAGIFIDHRNRIYVADSFNKRIQIFELLEKVER
ncbi:MAG: 6-bladed beta-propeller [Phycisphaerales bacterium]|nr:MAG: 6-bladed beta-propeller [Phycisphaerales bacterium]